MDPHKHNITGTIKKKQHRKEANNIVNDHDIAWHDAQPNMMHVRINEAWHGKVHKQYYKLSAAQYATSFISTKHHIHLFSSLPVMYSTKLNVIKHGKG